MNGNNSQQQNVPGQAQSGAGLAGTPQMTGQPMQQTAPMTSQAGGPQAQVQPQQGVPGGVPQQKPPLSQDLASLANILTQIQYDLFDISVQLAQPPDPDKPFNSRIDDKAVSWIQDLINKISGQLPNHEDPILPVGSQLACEFYQAKTLAQRTLTEIGIFYGRHEAAKPDNYKQINQYMQNLVNLMFVIFRWSNLVSGEKEWFWKTKDQMAASNAAAQAQKNQQASQSQPNQGGAPTSGMPGVSKS